MPTAVSTLPPGGSTGLSQFGDRTVNFVCQALRADWGCFYLLDAAAHPFAFRPRGVPQELYLGYIEHDMWRSDALHPRHLKLQDRRRFALLNDPRIDFPPEERRRYWRFLSSFGARYAGEMVFCHQGRAVAGLSLIWRKKSAPPDSVGLGLSVQSYVEFNIGSQCTAPPIAGEWSHSLTPREQEVARLTCCGCTNADIARRLNITLATVKTHLIHVFGKTGVSNRAALVNRILSEALSRQP